MAIKREWEGWRGRLRAYLRENEIEDADAGATIGLSRELVRSWQNGHRTPNIDTLIRLCEEVGADPACIIFGARLMTNQDQEQVLAATRAALQNKPLPAGK